MIMLDDIEALFKHLARHRFLYGSVVIHVAVLFGFYYHGPFQIEQRELREQSEQVREYQYQAEYSELESRVDDMKRLEELIEKLAESLFSERDTEARLPSDANAFDKQDVDSEKAASELAIVTEDEAASDTQSDPKKVGDSHQENASLEADAKSNQDAARGSSQENTSAESDMVELLRQAQQIAERSEDLRDSVRAEKLAELLDVPIDEALNTLRAENDSSSEIADFADGLSEESRDSIRETITQYHQSTRDNLSELVGLESQRKQGLTLDSATTLSDGIGNDGSEAINGGARQAGGETAEHKLEGGGDKQSELAGLDNQQTRSAVNSTFSNLSASGIARESGEDLISNAQDALDTSARRFPSKPSYGTGENRIKKLFDPSLPEREARPGFLGKHAQYPAEGRILGEGGVKADQVFIGSWYWIGPFEFLGRENRDKPYPPEFKVDLDAVYQGKRGIVAWEFHSDNEYPLEPPEFDEYAVFYAYNDVYFEQDTTAWVATACDDDCKLWVNDELVWRSGNQSKVWFTAEGYPVMEFEMKNRDLTENYYKVRFRKGSNKLLFRLDNTFNYVFFSLTINRDPSSS